MIADDSTVGLAEAAHVVGWDRSALRKLLVQHAVVPVEGARGKGGRLRVAVAYLPIVEAATRLASLGVPRSSIRSLSLLGIERSRTNPRSDLLLLHRGEAIDDVLVDPHVDDLRRALQSGFAAVLVEADRGEELVTRMRAMQAPRRRGRPRLDAAYIEAKLRASASLGSDVADPAAEIRRLSGE